MMRTSGMMLLGLAVVLSGCANQGLRQLTSGGDGPDEFLIIPNKPLEQPTDFAALPEPTPGGANRVDQLPLADATVALGGNPARLEGGIPASDGALVTAASRFGVDPDVRETLAAADAQFRKRKARFTQIRLFPTDRYAEAYKRQSIDPFAETERFRRAGIQTPTSPPKNP